MESASHKSVKIVGIQTSKCATCAPGMDIRIVHPQLEKYTYQMERGKCANASAYVGVVSAMKHAMFINVENAMP